ncbi:hypothetical protein MMC07_004724 [Pseudocyphellaria aurata]|nr:hypothetical protein [Pseudocyphellaria aurata]
MPGLLDRTSKKRKRKTSQGHAAVPASSPVSNKCDEILRLETQILESRRHYNSIVKLLDYVKEQEKKTAIDENSVMAAAALCRVFCRLSASGNMSLIRETSKSETVIVQWLIERLQEYQRALLSMLALQSPGVSATALMLLMQLIKEGDGQPNVNEDAIWCSGVFSNILQTLVYEPTIVGARASFIDDYFVKYDDVRYHSLVRLVEFASSDVSSASLDNILSILSALETVPASRDDIKDFFGRPPTKTKHSLYSPAAHKRRAQEAWMAVFRHDLTRSQRRTALELMSQRIAPWFSNVELLMDFLTDSFNVGGSTSLMALSGLFYLIQENNLDYPQFYLKLYSLLDPHLLHSKNRSRFFCLLDTFLASTHLPAALVASFIKRLSRLTIHAPPSGIVVVVPWIYNLLKRHPACSFMIHRKLKSGTEALSPEEERWGDPFCLAEPRPMETRALESSLWEIQMLQSHYHPNVAAIAKIISEQFTKQAYSLEDFLDHSYGTMLDAELSKDMKKSPEVDYEIPKKIFSKHDTELGRNDSLVVALWQFD